MATRKEPTMGRYRILRDCAVGRQGEKVDLDADTAADLIRDGMVAPTEEV